ncbi:hypothetical protein JCM8547_001116 [Rhodosporidiobolus lusitaniae]
MPSSRPSPPHNNPATAPELAITTDVTLRLLQRFYKDVRHLADAVEGGLDALVREGDSDDFRKLVEGMVLANSSETGLPILPVTKSYTASVSISEVIDQVQQRIFAAHAKVFRQEKLAGRPAFATPKNVLALGYRLSTERTNDMSQTRAQRTASFVSVFPNTVISGLNSSVPWALLLSRLGPDAVIELFSNPSIAVFTALPNACLMQVSGVPVGDLKMLDEITATSSSTTRPSRGAHQRTKRKRRKRCRAELDEVEEKENEQELEAEDETMRPVDEPVQPPPPPLPRIALAGSPSPTKSSLRPTVSAPLLSPSRPSPFSHATPSLTPFARLPLRATRSLVSVSGSEAVERPKKRRKMEVVNTSNAVVFARHRMYHNRTTKVKKGQQRYGLPQKHVLIRLPSLFPSVKFNLGPPTFIDEARTEAPARHLAKYIFPRQFSLHNPFTCRKPRSSFEVIPDYLDRELEIKKLGSVKTPPRLKPVLELLTKLAVLSQRCNYRKLLDRCCPSKMTHKRLDEEEKSAVLDLTSEPRTQASRGDQSFSLSHPSTILPHGQSQARKYTEKKPRLAEYACSFCEVESFVRNVVEQVIPRAFWGSVANYQLIQSQIASFIRLRRFESTSVHALLQGFSILDCTWLAPPTASHRSNKQQKPTAQDMEKRRELLSDFLFWLFDGFLIDLIRTVFYVTDAATHQNRPLYFRQDDWNALCAPLLENLGQSVFEKVPTSQLLPLQQKRELGFSFVRLMPKETGVRLIVNLARRPLKIGLNGQKEVGQPINKVLRSVFDVLTFERKRKPHLVGSLVSDPYEIFSKLKRFKMRLLEKNKALTQLYFVKVDVQACYDTIQQDKLLQIVEDVLSETMYWVQNYTRVTQYGEGVGKQFKRQACTDGDIGVFEELAEKLAENLHHALLTDQVTYRQVARDKILQLLREHISNNLVKVGGRLFRQKDGIPQGSIMSSLLCSLFYGDMERKRLAFTDDPDSVMLRYVDDFLFVTTKKPLAVRFLETMSDGIPEYGCAISSEKRLTNFDVSLENGEVVPPLPRGQDFTWCGLAINPQSLDIQFSAQSQMDKEIVDQLTIQRHRRPGQAFLNAMFRAAKVRSHVLYSDTSYNSPSTAYANVYRGMLVVALKFQAYVQEWEIDAKAKSAWLLRKIQQVVAFGYAALVHRARARKSRLLKVDFSLKRPWVVWLSYHAFHRVLSRRPSTYTGILSALEQEVRSSARAQARIHLAKIVKDKETGFADKTNGRRKERRV